MLFSMRINPLQYLFTFIFLLFFFPLSSQALPHPYFSKHPKDERQLVQLIKRAQLQLLEYQPVSFSKALSDLKGKRHTLEELKGNVLLLGRWATWCSACKAEMPLKKKLRQLIPFKNFKLVGISTESAENVRDYYGKNPNPYDLILLDPHSLTNDLFPSRSIPATLLIDGWGWSIAFARGARPWNTKPYIDLINFLLARIPSADEIKEKAPAPVVHFESPLILKKNHPATLTFSLTWAGERDKYSHISLKLPPHRDIKTLSMQTSSLTTDTEGNHRIYRLKILATKSGKFLLKPIVLHYWLKDYDHAFQKTLKPLSLIVRSPTPTATSLSSRQIISLLFFFLAFLLILIIIFLARRRKLAAQRENDEKTQKLEKLKELLQKLEEYDHHQQDDEFIALLFKIHKQFLHEEDSELESVHDAVRYGGQSLDPQRKKEFLDRLHSRLQRDYQL